MQSVPGLVILYGSIGQVGPRANKDRERFPPNNILLMLAGAGLLWMGWTGFNGGDPYTVSVDASLAVLNTHVCTATSLLVWLLLDIMFFGKPSVIGAIQGMITGLVCITPAAVMVLHKKISFLKHVDDTMAIFHTHAIAGSLGGILTGIFAEPKLCRIFYLVPEWEHYIGLLNGFHDNRAGAGFKQLGVQLLGILFVVFVNVIMTSIICVLIRLVVPLRLSEEELSTGDDAIHGEEAYALWGDGEKYESRHDSFYGADQEIPHSTKSGGAGGQVEMA
ncbi:unnamed protein product [Linum tenue]|uniref:Ammonium transporter AmtB-like domain-containing protein n=1 Tax=Linum tenue TaxID=586396 RepID=A0AAV0LJX8_9ROSI|nr:unnamed protein product [Linum tenue]